MEAYRHNLFLPSAFPLHSNFISSQDVAEPKALVLNRRISSLFIRHRTDCLYHPCSSAGLTPNTRIFVMERAFEFRACENEAADIRIAFE
jgi:hypothetical protein